MWVDRWVGVLGGVTCVWYLTYDFIKIHLQFVILRSHVQSRVLE